MVVLVFTMYHTPVFVMVYIPGRYEINVNRVQVSVFSVKMNIITANVTDL